MQTVSPNTVHQKCTKCVAARNRQKIHKPPYFGAQGHSRSLNSAPIESQYTISY